MGQHGADPPIKNKLLFFFCCYCFVFLLAIYFAYYTYRVSIQYLIGKLVITPRGHETVKVILKKSIARKPTLCGCRLVEASSAVPLA